MNISYEDYYKLCNYTNIDLTDELREKISNGLRREFHFSKHNPTAKSKDFSDILTNYQK